VQYWRTTTRHEATRCQLNTPPMRLQQTRLNDVV